MNYQVLARKSRPSQFEDVVGQEHITKTLQNAIKAGRIGHAYLFSGPRGVGKTTSARLLAKALNCESGPTDSPCGTCVCCREIAEGNSMDVIEVDGASNNGVEEARSLLETIKYNPSPNKYKIYIIDEVHMLTIAAFNALLKNLEEPPPRVIFIFATTELHKVPETIQSRCQQFTFTLIPQEVIVGKLRKLVEKEGVTAGESVLEIVARASGGSMRDAETILEKVMTYCGKEISEEKALEALGIVSRDLFYHMAEAILTEKTEVCFEIVQKVISGGRNMEKFIRESIDFFRNILLAHIHSGLTKSLPLPEEEKKKIRELADKFGESQLLFILDVLCKLESEMKVSFSPRVLVEMAFVKISHARNMLPIETIVAKLRDMEDKFKRLPRSETHPPHPSAQTPTPGNATLSFSPESIKKKWSDFLTHLERKNPILGQRVGNAIPSGFSGNVLTLQFDESAFSQAKVLKSHESEETLSKELTAFFNHHIIIKIELNSESSIANHEEDSQSKPPPVLSFKMEATNPENNFVMQALDVFGGDIVQVNKPPQKKGD